MSWGFVYVLFSYLIMDGDSLKTLGWHDGFEDFVLLFGVVFCVLELFLELVFLCLDDHFF